MLAGAGAPSRSSHSRAGSGLMSGPRRVVQRACRVVCTSLAACAASACATSGCNSESTLVQPTESVASPHFELRVSAEELAACATPTEPLEAYYLALSDFFSLPAPHTVYTKFTNRASFRKWSGCSNDASACFQRGRGVFSRQWLNRHELTHAFLAQLGDSHRALEEGIAVALSCGIRDPGRSGLGYEQLFSSAGWYAEGATTWEFYYRAAARFVAFVVRRYGVARFLSLYRTLTPRDEVAAVEEAVARVLGQELAEIWSQAMADGRPESACLYIWECASERVNTCDGAAFRVRTDDEATFWRATRDGSDAVRGCTLDSAPPPPQGGRLGSVIQLLPAGQHFTTADARPQVLSSSQICADRNEALNVDRQLTLALAPTSRPVETSSAAVLWLPVTWDGARRVAVACSPGLAVRLCTECDNCRFVCDSNVSVSDVELSSPRSEIAIDLPIPEGAEVQLTPRYR